MLASRRAHHIPSSRLSRGPAHWIAGGADRLGTAGEAGEQRAAGPDSPDRRGRGQAGEGDAGQGEGRGAAGPRAQPVGVRAARQRSDRDRRRPEGHRLRHQLVAQQPAARHPRPSGLDADRPHAEERGRPAQFLPPRHGAGEQREEPVDPGRQQGRLARHPRPHRIQGTPAPGPGHRWRRPRRRVPDHERGLQRRPDLGRGRRRDAPRRRHHFRDPAGRLSPPRYQRRRHDRSADDDRRGLQYASRVRRPRRLRRHPGAGRPPLLGGRRHRLQRHRQVGQALGGPEPGRRLPIRDGRIQLRGLRAGHPQPAGVLVRRARQPDQRGQRRRSPGRGRARRLHPVRVGQRLAFELAVRQVHRPEEQPLQRVDGRAGVQAAPCRPDRAHRAADRQLARRAVGHGLQPRHGALGRMEEPLLRDQLPGLGAECLHLRLHAEGRRRRLRDGAREVAASRHSRGRHQVRARRRALHHRLGHRLGLQEQRAAVEARRAGRGRQRDPQGSPDAAQREFREPSGCRRRRAARPRRHAHPAEGAIRSGAPRGRGATAGGRR